MPTSILLRADQVIELACLLQRMSLFLARTDDSGMSALASLSGRSGHQTRVIRTARFMRTPPKTRYVNDGFIAAP